MENHDNSIEALESQGFEFNPNDVVVILEYLVKLIDGHRFPEKRINCVDIYDHGPESLVSFPGHAGLKWFFYTRLNLKYFGGTKPVRKTKEGGVWKCTRTYRIREEGGKEIGLRRVLKYKEKGGHETDWVLWEYTSTATNEFALCKLFRKACKRARAAGSSNAAQENEHLDVGTSHVLATSPYPLGEEARSESRLYGLVLDVSEARCAQMFHTNIAVGTSHIESSGPPSDIAEHTHSVSSDVEGFDLGSIDVQSFCQPSEAEGVDVGTSHIESSGTPSDIAEGTSYGLIPDVPEEHTHSMSSWEFDGFDLGSTDVQNLCQPLDIAGSTSYGLPQFDSQEIQVGSLSLLATDLTASRVDSLALHLDVADTRSHRLNSDVSEVLSAETLHTTAQEGEGVDAGTSQVHILGPQRFGFESGTGFSPLRGEVIDNGQFWAEIDERQQNKADPVINSADKWILEAQLLW